MFSHSGRPPGRRPEEIALTQPLASTEVSKKPSRRPRRSPRPACHGGGRERSPKGAASHSGHHARHTAERPPGAALAAASSQRESKTSPRPPPSLATGAPHHRQLGSARSPGFATPRDGPQAEAQARDGEVGRGGTPRPRGAGCGARHLGAPPGRRVAYLRAEQAAGKAGRESEARRGEEAGDSAQALHASPILDSAGSPAAQHSLSAAGAAPGALIGSQRPGAGADRLMRVRAPRPLGEPPSGRRRGGGERAGKERKGKGRAVGEGRGARGAGRGRRGRGAEPAACEGPSSCRERPRLPGLPLATAGRPRSPHPALEAPNKPPSAPAPAAFRLDRFAEILF